MTPEERESVAYAPELAVILALLAVSDASCAALAAAHPLEIAPPHSVEYDLALHLYTAISRLQTAADAYCGHVAALRNLGPDASDDIPF